MNNLSNKEWTLDVRNYDHKNVRNANYEERKKLIAWCTKSNSGKHFVPPIWDYSAILWAWRPTCSKQIMSLFKAQQYGFPNYYKLGQWASVSFSLWPLKIVKPASWFYICLNHFELKIIWCNYIWIALIKCWDTIWLKANMTYLDSNVQKKCVKVQNKVFVQFTIVTDFFFYYFEIINP